MDNREWWNEPGEIEGLDVFERPGPGELDVEDAFADHNIEYWIWHNNRLVPASPDRAARLREIDALHRLDSWKLLEQETQRRARRAARYRRVLEWIHAVSLWVLARGAMLSRQHHVERASENAPRGHADQDSPTAYPHGTAAGIGGIVDTRPRRWWLSRPRSQ